MKVDLKKLEKSYLPNKQPVIYFADPHLLWVNEILEALPHLIEIAKSAEAFCGAAYGTRDHLLADLEKRLEGLKC